MPDPPAISSKFVRLPIGVFLAMAGPRTNPRQSIAAVKVVANSSVNIASLQVFSSL